MILETVLFGILIAVLIGIGLIILFKAAGIIIKILLHMLFGVIMLFIVNILPFVDVPINILTVLVAGFGGFIGVILLVILNLIGFI
jgi:inhibitor of the pro-sigma K processing machinery